MVAVLAQRAASEGPRWTRAVGDQSGHPPVKKCKDSLGGGREKRLFDARSELP